MVIGYRVRNLFTAVDYALSRSSVTDRPVSDFVFIFSLAWTTISLAGFLAKSHNFFKAQVADHEVAEDRLVLYPLVCSWAIVDDLNRMTYYYRSRPKSCFKSMSVIYELDLNPRRKRRFDHLQ